VEFIHPIVIILAILSGVYTGYLGWKRFRFRRGRGSSSDFPWQRHIQWGKRFYILLWIGSFIGVGALFYLKGTLLTSGLHASTGVSLGWKLSKGNGTNRLASIHMVINYSTFFFVLIQIVLGVIFLTFFLSA
jgi:heme/copper-type cytochrome/quinol oxidase subunit 2